MSACIEHIRQRDTVELRLDARPENLALARLALAGVAANAGARREIVSDLKLAVTEACTNVDQARLRRRRRGGEIVVRYTVEPGARGRGRGHGRRASSPSADAPPRPRTETAHGMGLMIIRVAHRRADDLQRGTGTRVAFVKRFSPEADVGRRRGAAAQVLDACARACRRSRTRGRAA